jgi:hypothetical protein
MRSLRLFRSNASRSAEQVEANLDPGLLAFASEAGPETVSEQEAQPRTPASSAVLYLLLGLVLLQAAPTFLWIKSRVRPPAEATVAALPPPAPAASIVPTPPCEPAPAPVEVASAAAAPARSTATGPSPAAAAAAAAAPAPPSMMAGLVAITAPVPMHVYLRGKLVGTTEAETIMLPVGSQELEFRNDAVGYLARRTVVVQPGKTVSTKLEVPPGTLHVNAVPWADVTIDSQRIGETPIGNLQMPVGTHEVVFRHPDFGERRTTVLVTLKEPARVSMDMRKK